MIILTVLSLIILFFLRSDLYQGLMVLLMNSLQLLGITSQEKFNKSHFFKNIVLFNNSFYWKINTK